MRTAVVNGVERVFAAGPSSDVRNFEHLVGDAPSTPNFSAWKVLERGAIRLDQGQTSHCAAYAGGNAWKIGAKGSPSNPQCDLVYARAQKLDEWPGEEPRYYGTSTSGSLKAWREQRKVKSWVWCRSPEDIVAAIIAGKPVCWPAVWREAMAYPNSSGIMSASGAQIGGHLTCLMAWVGPWRLVGVENSWGAGWANDGMAWLPYTDLVKLWGDWPEAAVPSW